MAGRMRRRIDRRILLVAALAIASMGLMVTPAQAAAQNCYNRTGPTYGAWSTARAYNYAPGGWCMHAVDDPSYRLVWQTDGNLVAYFNISANNPSNARWSSGTSGRGARLSFQVDGNLVVYDSANRPLWASGQSTNRNASTYFRLRFKLVTSGPTYWILRIEQYSPYAILWTRRV